MSKPIAARLPTRSATGAYKTPRNSNSSIIGHIRTAVDKDNIACGPGTWALEWDHPNALGIPNTDNTKMEATLKWIRPLLLRLALSSPKVLQVTSCLFFMNPQYRGTIYLTTYSLKLATGERCGTCRYSDPLPANGAFGCYDPLREENIKTFQEMITVSDGSQFGAEEIKCINPLENAGPMFLQARRSPRMQRY